MTAHGGPGDDDHGAAVAESHTAVVVFLGDRAYKIKKPVDFGFLDFTTVTARHVACRREIELNRRLAPDVYLDLGQVLDGNGRTREWIVVMRRMPPARRLSTLIQRGADVSGDLQQLARILASFHSSARTGPGIGAAGRRAALRKRWTDNLAGAQPFVGDLIDPAQFDTITRLALDYVDGREPLLDDRVRRGCVIDGHGDLQAEDIFCLSDTPRVLDCLEFDDALRYVDGLDDVAFLAMDLERLGAPELAARFLGWYREFSGTEVAASLAHHYTAYRAFVRAKVACLRHAQGAPEAAEQARGLARMTVDHLRAGQVRLVVVGGLPGTGKSTIAGGLADRMGAVLLSTDQIRREVPGMAELPTRAGYGRGRYERSHVHDTYREMLARTRALIGHGETVVLDASWSSAEERRQARTLASDGHAAVVELRCMAPLEITAARIASRAGSTSDATVDVATRMRADFAPWPEATPVDTSSDAQDALSAAWNIVEPS